MHAARDEGERAEAVECAKAAARYVHPKLAPTSPPAPVHEEMDYTVRSDRTRPVEENLLEPAQAATGHRCHLSICLRFGALRHRLEAHRVALRQGPDAGMAKDQKFGFKR